jgi:PAS domain S-box-containing protein
MTVLTLALILLGAVAVALAVALVQRAREIRRLRELGERVLAVAQSGDLAERLTPHAAAGSATDIAEGVDRLIERLQEQSAARDEREGIYRRLLGTMHEAMLVERDGIELANARFAELCGVANPAKLLGRRLSELVRAEYSELVDEYLRRHLAGESAPERLEVDLSPNGANNPHRLELSFARSTLDGRPAVIVTGLEMAPAVQAPGSAQRSHASAWEALDSLAESVLTTDVEGRIVYINSAGEQLIGKPTEEILGRTLGDVIELVDEGDRKTAGDPVRQALSRRRARRNAFVGMASLIGFTVVVVLMVGRYGSWVTHHSQSVRISCSMIQATSRRSRFMKTEALVHLW